jgi:hypothetical protein
MADRDDTRDAAPAGEHIHMPEPSIIPVLNAAGLAAAIIGITLSLVIVIAGLLLFFGTAIVWIRDARREMEDLPLEHGH